MTMAQINVVIELHWEGLLFKRWPGYLLAVLPEIFIEIFCVLSNASISCSRNAHALWWWLWNFIVFSYILQLKFPLNNTMLSSGPTKTITGSSRDKETCFSVYEGKNWDQVTKVIQTTVSTYKRDVTFVLTLGLSIKFIYFPFFKVNGGCLDNYHYRAML
jgi:hypothetical protein